MIRTSRLHLVFCLLFFRVINLNAQTFLSNSFAPIQLTIPFNEQKLDVRYPLFSWSGNMDFTKNNASYVIRIVEMYPYQTAQSAILSNPVFFEKEVGAGTLLQYPVDAPALSDCRIYAWQVIAYDNKTKIVDERKYTVKYTNKIGQSEPYMFTTKCNQSARITNASLTQPYIILAKTVDNYVYRVENKKLNFKYIEDYAAYELKYKIYNWKREVLLTNNPNVPSTKVALDYGWNYLSVDLNNAEINPPVAAGNIYQLEVETPKGDIYKAKFEIQ
ncbi:MAG: hypothetical protein IPM95_06770 [Sphingobacteriales bacterium]|nr:hypothetical protein [Sphingobacteriales bacterium]